jgi:hypothetical protein
VTAGPEARTPPMLVKAVHEVASGLPTETAQDGRGAPVWVEPRRLRRFWFPFNTQAARVDALVHAPAAFRRRGVYLAAHELDVA